VSAATSNHQDAELSIVIVSWNSASVIDGCLDSILRNPPERRFEILVLDNASADESLERARRFPRPVEVIALGANLGFAAACNEGCRRSSGDYLLFLNSDIRASPSALETLCRFLDSSPEAGAVGGKLLGDDGAPQRGFNVRAFPTLASTAFEILMVDKAFPSNAVSREQRMLDFTFLELAEVDQPAGACLMVRKTTFEAVGLFDEQFQPAWFEDVDLCLRLKRAGHKIFFLPEACFDHQGGASLEHLEYRAFLSFYYRNLFRFYQKHHGKLTTVILRVMVVIGMLERILIGLFLPPKPALARRDALAAYWQVLKESV
jgi:GT2 family glycosyltransferase